MQIDFHHAVTYVCGRLGGLTHEDASVVAHAAQYVDDATNDGPLQFASGERYVRVTSAHRTLDLRLNGDAGDNRLVWVPFHFLPGNDPTPVAAKPDEVFLRRMVCRPNSQIAQEMVKHCIDRQDTPFALHRLGIALHTFVDTWAHQGFVGMISDFNKVRSVSPTPDAAYKDSAVFGELRSGGTQASQIVANLLPVGHAAVLTFPDLPFLRWTFKRANGEVVERDNPTDFLEAATQMFNMVRRFVSRSSKLADVALPAADRARIDQMLRTTLAIDGTDRHKAWLEAIARGDFSFGAAPVTYVESGVGSWKYEAVGADPDTEDGTEKFSFQPGFLSSNWKRFHDAVQYHRLFILHELLPSHGISAA